MTDTPIEALVARLRAAAEGAVFQGDHDVMQEAIADLTAKDAELAQVKAARDAMIASAYEAAAETLDTAGDSAVTAALGERLCCSGQMCGCQGADVGAFLQHLIRTLTPAHAQSALSRLIRDAESRAYERAAALCAEKSEAYRASYKSLRSIHAGEPHIEGLSDGMDEAREMILALRKGASHG